jgi:DNA-binding PadR family transcriptional regulator
MSLPLFDLTSFQRDVLYVTMGFERPSGQQIKSELESRTGTITHGRLYPNLDTLVEEGYIEKGSIDRRTNFYDLTEAGAAALAERREWEDAYVDFG